MRARFCQTMSLINLTLNILSTFILTTEYYYHSHHSSFKLNPIGNLFMKLSNAGKDSQRKGQKREL